jgi:hypothetical protein
MLPDWQGLEMTFDGWVNTIAPSVFSSIVFFDEILPSDSLWEKHF